MKPFLFSLFILLLSSTACQAADAPNIIQNTQRSMVSVMRPADTGYYFCTGVMIGKFQVLTAKHCVADDSTGLTVDAAPAKISKTSEFLALLTVALVKPSLDIAAHEPRIGEQVITLGYGWEKFLALLRHVASYQTNADMADEDAPQEKESVSGRLMLIDGNLAPGMSGGPVVNMNGELVGINQGTNEVIGVTSSVAAIRDFLK